MNNKLQIIETPEYYLAVSEEEIKESNCGLITSAVMTYEQMIKEWGEPLGRKIIAYQPKNNAPTLDLPLLPQMVVESEVEKLAIINEVYPEYYTEHNAFIKSYKAATKIYSEDDMIRIAIHCWNIASRPIYGVTYNVNEIALDYMKSLKQHQTPKYFIAETENKLVLNLGIDVYDPNTHVVSNELKTTTIDGKTYCVGCYLCD